MPFKSEKQRRFMWAEHPDIAKKWAHGEHAGKGKRHSMPDAKASAKRHLKRQGKK